MKRNLSTNETAMWIPIKERDAIQSSSLLG